MDTIGSLGFIGGGNMASAIIGGICRNEYLPPEKIYVYDPDVDKTKALREQWGIRTAEGIASLVAVCDWVLLAVKPNIVPQVLDEIREGIGQARPAIISIAAGVSLHDLENGLDPAVPIVRVMPNTPAMVGEGMSVLCGNNPSRVTVLVTAVSLFRTVGKAVVMEEKYFDAVTAVSGSGPAYVCMFIEALADGGVREGLPRDTAYTLACQTVLGTARLIEDTGTHPGVWKDRVCSPGGTTIDAVRSLESGGFRGTVMDAVSTCADKSRKLGKRA